MGPFKTGMPGVDSENSEVITISPQGDALTIDSTSSNNTDAIEAFDNVETELVDKPFKWHGVEFPAWAKGPHFVILNDRTFALAMDPAFVSMEMKTNWMQKYVPELVKLGKQVLEKLLKEEIKSV